MMRMTNGREDGFSLVEILVVFVMIGIALVPLAGVQLNSRRAVNESLRYGEAVELAQNRIEKLRTEAFSTATADSVRDGNFTVVTNISPETDPGTGVPSTELQRLNVRVLWNEKGTPRSVVLEGLRANR